MAIRPRERDAIATLLDSPAPSANDLAVDVLRTIDRLRAERTDWYVLVVDPGVCVHLHGPFITKNAAQKAIDRGVVFAASENANALILQLNKHDEEGNADV